MVKNTEYGWKRKYKDKILKNEIYIIQISTKNMEYRKHYPGNVNSAKKSEP